MQHSPSSSSSKPYQLSYNEWEDEKQFGVRRHAAQALLDNSPYMFGWVLTFRNVTFMVPSRFMNTSLHQSGKRRSLSWSLLSTTKIPELGISLIIWKVPKPDVNALYADKNLEY